MREAHPSAPAFDVGETIVHEIAHEGVADGVERLPPLVSAPYQLEAAEEPELVAQR